MQSWHILSGGALFVSSFRLKQNVLTDYTSKKHKMESFAHA